MGEKRRWRREREREKVRTGEAGRREEKYSVRSGSRARRKEAEGRAVARTELVAVDGEAR